MRSKRTVVGAFLGAAAVVVAASAAWACTSFSTLRLGQTSGGPGTELAVTGAGAEAGKPVTLRWGSLTGPVLATAVVDAGGAFAIPVTVPEGLGGVHVVLAIDAAGDVARAAFEVTGARYGGGSSAGTGAGGAGGSPSQPLAGGLLILALGVGGLAVVGGGLAVAGRQREVVAAG